MKRIIHCMLAGSLCLMAIGCATTKVSRMDASEEMDLSGFWNDTDSRLVSEEMIRDCIARAWLADFTTEKGKKPRVIVGRVKNKSAEHIATDTFVKDMERELINSGKVKFVVAKGAREEIREERADQQKFSGDAKEFFKEKSADFMLQGGINSILDSVGGKTVRFYQIELELIDMESNEKVWIGQKKIKKLVKKSKYGM